MLFIFLITLSSILAAVFPIATILLTLLILLMVLIFKNPGLGLGLTIFSAVLGQLARFNIILLTDALAAITLLSFWLNMASKKNRPGEQAWRLPLILFLLWSLAGWLVNWPEYGDIFSIFYLIRFAIFSCLLFTTGKIQSPNIVRCVFWSITLIAALGLAQIIILPDLTPLTKYGWDPHQNRLVSTWLDPNFVGLALILGLLLSIVEPAWLFKKVSPKWLKLTLISIFLLSIVLTFSRASYLALAISLLALGIFHKASRKTLAITLGLILILGLIFPRSFERLKSATEIDATARFRIKSWQNTLAIAKDNLIFGVGFNNFKQAQIKYGTSLNDSHSASGSDSSWLLILADTGVIGLAIFSWFYFNMLKWLYLDHQNKLKLVLFCFLIGLLFHSQFVNSLFYSHLLILWLALIIKKCQTA